MNVEVYFGNPVGVGDHIDIMETISKEIGQIAEYEDKLMILDTHFTPHERVKI